MLTKLTIADYMTQHLVTLKADTGVFDAIKLLLDHKITAAPVLDSQGRIVGMFSEKDCMKVVLETAYNQSRDGKIADFMSTDVVSVNANASIVDLAEKFQTSALRSFPVFNDQELVGMISRVDVLKALLKMK